MLTVAIMKTQDFPSGALEALFVHSHVYRNIKLLLDGWTDWFQTLLGVTDHDGECLHVTEFL